jgi:trans-2,3-dihydro-3-hydroxyanthranilate isomerase
VFTDRRYGGNPLAIVFEAGALDTEAMARIAREFNLSETVFVLAEAAGEARLRIFTPGGEVPFAGHPNVGTAIALAARGHGDTLTLHQPAGPVAARILPQAPAVAADIVAPSAFVRGADHDVAAVAACLSLAAEDVDTTAHPPTTGSVGLPFIFAALRSADALRRAKPDTGAFRHHFPPGSGLPDGVHCYVRTGNRADARMFAPLDGIMEDPATGSANAALGALLLALGGGTALALEITQGVAMGRPSRLSVQAFRDGGAIRARVGGPAVKVAEGAIETDT